MFCTYCGAQNPEGTEFCTHCGKKIGKSAAMTPKAPGVPFIKQYCGWIAVVGGSLTLIGYITPWVSMNVYEVMSGSYSALTGLFALIVSVFATILGTTSTYGDVNAVGVWMTIFSILMTIPCLLLLLFGIFNLRDGLRMKKLDKSNTEAIAGHGTSLKKRSTTCLVFLGIYFLIALLFSSFHLSGALGSLLGSVVGGTYLGIGFWLTTIGYIICLILGINLIPANEGSID